ncbi:hypothetical protein [Micromonospora sp. NPDC049679]|uniref:hypothetical protein n=1 Tax=Micromonospora sp. NPDC049679 TaxID=3155920 RepID=UPI0033D202A2
MTEHRREGTTPLPATVAAWFVLDLVPTERVPWWAARWLADGHDGEALRELAGLNGRDPHAVRDLLPRALADTGGVLPTTTVTAANEVFRELAERCLSGIVGERSVVQQVEAVVISTHYNNDVIDLPLGALYGTEYTWDGEWGRPIEELKASVRACCAAQLRASRQQDRR